MLCARGVQNNRSIADLVRLIRPETTLLRNLSMHISTVSGCFDRRRVDELLLQRPSPFSEQERLAVSHLVDATRHVPIRTRHVPFKAARYETVVTGLTLPVEHERVLEAGFFSALNTVKRPMTHVLSKVINIRCQARKFATVTLKLIKSDKEMASQLRHLLVCSLLGNYPHCRSSLVGVARLHTYSTWLDQNGRAELLFARLIQQCSLLVVNALRDFLIHAIDAEDALRNRLVHLMHLERFTTIVNDHMDRVRTYFDSMLRVHTSALSVYFSSDNEFAANTVYFDINRLLNGSHANILKISYRRPNLDIHQFLMGMRKRYPLVPLVSSELMLSVDIHDMEALVPGTQIDEDNTEEAGIDEPSNYLTAVQIECLKETLLRIDPLHTGSLLRLTEWLHFFGVPTPVIEYIQTHIGHYHYSSISTEQLKLKFGQLQRNHPHAYNLLQVASEFIKEFQKRHITLDAPVHLMINQLEAARERVGVNAQPSSILKSALQFVYCDVCKMVYSLLRDWKSVYKTSYKLGLRDAVVDYIADEIYCRRDKTNARGTCQGQPLRKLNLLGKVLMFQGKLIMLCPQIGCCAPMVIDSTLCEFTERGIACKDCTEQLQIRPTQVEELEQCYPCVDWKNESKPHRQCAVCQKKMEKHEEFALYPFDIVLCTLHSTSRMQRYVSQLMVSRAVANSKQLAQEMVEFCGRKRTFHDRHARQFTHTEERTTKKQKVFV